MEHDPGILETLLTRRRWIPLIALFSVLVGLGLAHRGGGTRTGGYAELQVLLGTVNGQASPLDGVSPQTLMIKAPLLADQLGTTARSAKVADRAGIDPNLLAVRVPAHRSPIIGVPIALAGAEVSAGSAVPYVLHVTADERLPLLTLTAWAPDAASAGRLVKAADSLLDEMITHAIPPRTKPSALLRIQQLGQVKAQTVTAKSKPVVAVVAGFLCFIIGCCALVAWTGIQRTRRRRRPHGSTTTMPGTA